MGLQRRVVPEPTLGVCKKLCGLGRAVAGAEPRVQPKRILRVVLHRDLGGHVEEGAIRCDGRRGGRSSYLVREVVCQSLQASELHPESGYEGPALPKRKFLPGPAASVEVLAEDGLDLTAKRCVPA